MIDYRSLERLEVFRGDARVATLNRLARGCDFRYEADFLASAEPPIALHLPKKVEPLVTEGVLNLPTYFAGLVPEGVMFTAAQTLIGSAKDDLFAVLAATGRDAIGDIDVRVPGAPLLEPPLLNLESAKGVIETILDRTFERAEVISAIPGIQPKMSIGGIVRANRGTRYIAKFPTRDFPGLPENEAACMTLARKCGLPTPRARVENSIYIVERFDRTSTGKIHVEDMLQALNLFPHSKYSVDFFEMCQEIEKLGVSPGGILQTIRLFAFSYMIGNGDLHAKNVSLVRRPEGYWVPSPAYDLVSTLPYKAQLTGADAMALAIADEAIGRFELQDFVAFGERFRIPERATQKAVTGLGRAVQRFARGLLAGVLPEEDVETVISRAGSLGG